jgi:hypothetical protein
MKLPDMRSQNSTHLFFVNGRKVTAASFILLIVIANIWFIYRLTGEAVPSWTSFLFFSGALGVLLGFLCMLPGWLNPSKLQYEKAEDEGCDKNDH